MGPKQRDKITIHGRPSANNFRWFKVRGIAPQLPAVHLTTPEQNETSTSTSRPPERKIRRFKVREIVQVPSPQIHHDQERPLRTRSYPKFLWRIGKLSKPEYTNYCNNIHAFHQTYLQGEMSLDVFQYKKEWLMVSIINHK